jgi:hypothetical protein
MGRHQTPAGRQLAACTVNLQGTLLRSTTPANKPVNAVPRGENWQSCASYRPGDAARYGGRILDSDGAAARRRTARTTGWLGCQISPIAERDKNRSAEHKIKRHDQFGEHCGVTLDFKARVTPSWKKVE